MSYTGEYAQLLHRDSGTNRSGTSLTQLSSSFSTHYLVLDKGFENSSVVSVVLPAALCTRDISIGLKEITYFIGWYNVEPALKNDTVRILRRYEGEKTIPLPAGYYSLPAIGRCLAARFGSASNVIHCDETNLVVSVLKFASSTNCTHVNIDGLSGILGFSKAEWLSVDPQGTLQQGDATMVAGRGDKSADMKRYKALYVHLDEIDIRQNWLNGLESTILQVVPVADGVYGQSFTVTYSSPEMRFLKPPPEKTPYYEDVTQRKLTLRIADQLGKPINMHGHPVIIKLEIHNHH